ncbi:FxLYD domain-containing protein [Kitasatospora sp. NPDC096147]|uniref:FxLYD domain-containing protein n=1 Tax=Kitasatospora sp. NPDC096147 TaxID=3364093 RepID=UPI003827635F
MRTLPVALVGAGLLLGLTACVLPASTTARTPNTAAPVPAVTGGQQPAASGPAGSSPAAAPAPAKAGDGDKLKDAEITGCKVDSVLGWPSADVKVTNHSSKASNYIVNVEFVDESNTRVAEGIAATNNLAPNQAAQLKAQGASETKGKKISCRVSDVTRYASP